MDKKVTQCPHTAETGSVGTEVTEHAQQTPTGRRGQDLLQGTHKSAQKLAENVIVMFRVQYIFTLVVAKEQYLVYVILVVANLVYDLQL